MKGSAYRCLKTGQPTDAVLERAAVEANLNIADILENLPAEMSVWIDPGEVIKLLHCIGMENEI